MSDSMVKTFFSIETSPTNWALDRAISLSNEKRHFSALGMMVVSTFASIPSSLKNLTCLVAKSAVAVDFALNLGQAPEVKARTWHKLEKRCLLSSTAKNTLIELALHVYKCVLFIIISPLCCLTVGLFTPTACKKVHDWLGLTTPQEEEPKSDEIASDDPLDETPKVEEEKVEDQTETVENEAVKKTSRPLPVPVPKTKPAPAIKVAEKDPEPMQKKSDPPPAPPPRSPESSSRNDMLPPPPPPRSNEASTEEIAPPPPPPPRKPPPPPPRLPTGTSESNLSRLPTGTSESNLSVSMLDAIKNFKTEEKLAKVEPSPEGEKKNPPTLTTTVTSSRAFETAKTRNKERPPSVCFSNWDEPEDKAKGTAEEPKATPANTGKSPKKVGFQLDEAESTEVKTTVKIEETPKDPPKEVKKTGIEEKPKDPPKVEQTPKDPPSEAAKKESKLEEMDPEEAKKAIQRAVSGRRLRMADTMRRGDAQKMLAALKASNLDEDVDETEEATKKIENV